MNIKKIETLDNILNNKLWKMIDNDELKPYLEALMLKCLQCLQQNDIYNYEKYKKDLLHAIQVARLKVENFDSFYKSIQLHVASLFLKDLFNDDDLILFDAIPDDPEFVNIDEITDCKEFLRYSMAVENLEFEKNNLIIENEAYTVIIEGEYITFIRKHGRFSKTTENAYYSINAEVLESFINYNELDSEIEDITYNRINQLCKIYEYIEDTDFDDSSNFYELTGYNKENTDFIVFINDEMLKIFDKKTAKAFKCFISSDAIPFMMHFCDYHLERFDFDSEKGQEFKDSYEYKQFLEKYGFED